MKNITNQNGLTLIEALIAAGVLSVLAFAFATYMNNLSKQQKRAQEKIAYMQLQTHITAVANDPQNIFESGEVVVGTKQVTPGGSGPGGKFPGEKLPGDGQHF